MDRLTSACARHGPGVRGLHARHLKHEQDRIVLPSPSLLHVGTTEAARLID